MSNTKRTVTVYVPTTAAVSHEQIERYMLRLGWSKADYRCRIYEHPKCGKLHVHEPLDRVVMKLAEYEDRGAGEVLRRHSEGGSMTTKHEVTVYDRVPATAQISATQIESYLRRTGWSECHADAQSHIWKHWQREVYEREQCVGQPMRIDYGDYVTCLGRMVDEIAEAESRRASAVLADIAREPES